MIIFIHIYMYAHNVLKKTKDWTDMHIYTYICMHTMSYTYICMHTMFFFLKKQKIGLICIYMYTLECIIFMSCMICMIHTHR